MATFPENGTGFVLHQSSLLLSFHRAAQMPAEVDRLSEYIVDIELILSVLGKRKPSDRQYLHAVFDELSLSADDLTSRR